LKLTKSDDKNNHEYEFTESDLDIVENYAALGLGMEDICATLSVSKKFLWSAMKKEQEAAESFTGSGKYKTAFEDFNVYCRYNRGLHRHKTVITKGLMEHAIKGNPQVLMFLARTKLGWNEKVVQDDQNAVNAELLSEIVVDFVEAEQLPEATDEN